MKKTNLSTAGMRKINPDWFTAKTYMREIGGPLKIKEQQVFHVYFENGSRTKLHMHNGSQVLIVTRGKGSIEMFKKSGSKKDAFSIKRTKKILLKKDDTVYIPSGTLHTHGSVQGGVFSHIAINILARKNSPYKTTWYESDFKSRVSGIV